MPTRDEEILHLLQNYASDEVIVCHLWSGDDVRATAKEMRENGDKIPRLSKADVEEILRFVEHHLDSELGITWDTIKYAIEITVSRKEKNGTNKES